MDFTNWAPNEPKLGETADCCRLKNDFSMFGMWRDGVCTDNCPYICKKLKSKILLYNVFRNRSLKRSQESILVSRFARIRSWQQICKNPFLTADLQESEMILEQKYLQKSIQGILAVFNKLLSLFFETDLLHRLRILPCILHPCQMSKVINEKGVAFLNHLCLFQVQSLKQTYFYICIISVLPSATIPEHTILKYSNVISFKNYCEINLVKKAECLHNYGTGQSWTPKVYIGCNLKCLSWLGIIIEQLTS